jgi:D-tyrosyl-tRNA(Tyr) deacylase
MRIVIQRVSSARIRVDGVETAAIGTGLLLLVGVERGDGVDQMERAADKIVTLRIFPVSKGVDDRMDRSVLDVSGEILVVSQFTLAGSIRKGRRPSFDNAAPPEEAEALYVHFVSALREKGGRVSTGIFRAMMDVELVNDGPVTFVLEGGR